jgi:hypothetical protein
MFWKNFSFLKTLNSFCGRFQKKITAKRKEIQNGAVKIFNGKLVTGSLFPLFNWFNKYHGAGMRSIFLSSIVSN